MKPGSSDSKRFLCVSAALVTLTVLIYAQTLGYPFVRFDDNWYVYNNPHIQDGLTWQGVRWAFTAGMTEQTLYADYWQPMTVLTRMIDIDLYGLNPGGHHLTNLVIHAANTILLLTLLYRMTANFWPSAFVAAVFAAHPQHVESVAWVTERKDVLCAFFSLWTMNTYVRYCRAPGFGKYVRVVSLFVLALMSKPIAVTVPVVLLLLDAWPLGRFGRRAWIEKIPLLLFAMASTAVTVAGDPQAVGRTIPADKMFEVPLSYGWYAWKAIWPADLAVFYPPFGSHSVSAAAITGLMMIAVTVGCFIMRHRRPYLAVGWFWFLATLAPTLVLARPSVADRFTYLPHIGLAIAAAWTTAEFGRRWKFGKQILAVVGGLCIAGFSAAAHSQTGYWKDTVTLFERALETTKNNSKIHETLGAFLADKGRTDEALAHLNEAARIDPRSSFARANLGNIYSKLGQRDTALAHYAEAIRIEPRHAHAHHRMGLVLMSRGKWEEAELHLREALQINPKMADAWNDLGVVRIKQKSPDDAANCFTKAIEIDAEHVDALNNLANARRESAGLKISGR